MKLIFTKEERNKIYLEAFRKLINREENFICLAIFESINKVIEYFEMIKLFPELGDKEYTRDVPNLYNIWFNFIDPLKRQKRATILYLCYLETL
jgi:hypothetical protein